MTRRTAMTFLKDYGGVIGGLSGLTGLLMALVYALGFGVSTPQKAFASVSRRLDVLEADQSGVVGLQRYFCYRDRQAADLFIPCDRLNANNVAGR